MAELALALIFSGSAFLIGAPIASHFGPPSVNYDPIYVIGGALIVSPGVGVALVWLGDTLAGMKLHKPGERQVRASEPPVANSRHERDISGQLVRLIDVLYGLVIVQGAIAYRSIATSADNNANPAVIVALALIMYTVVRSFVDWHTHMEGNPFQIVTCFRRRLWGRGPELQVRTLDLWRLYVDFLIVASYSLLLLRAHVLLGSPGARLTLFFWAFPVVYAMYLVWGELLRSSTGESRQFAPLLISAALLASACLAALYTILVDTKSWTGTAPNVVALGLEGAIMMTYRHYNWKQRDTIVEARPEAL